MLKGNYANIIILFLSIIVKDEKTLQELTDISAIKDILSRHGFTFSKSLGQNFLVNPSVCPRMASLCFDGEDDFGAIEIGPGIGVLTKELSKRAKKVVAIELDSRLIPVLGQTLSQCGNVEVINADVLKLNLSKLIEEKFSGMKTVVCANLPYYITSEIIMMLLESRLQIESVTVMVQKEAAQRLCAPVGTRAAGAVTVAVNYFAKAEKLFDVSAGSFMPKPKVDSSVIRLKIKKQPDIFLTDEKRFFKVVKAAFSMRRKTVLNAVSAGLSIDKGIVLQAMQSCGLEKNLRAENLTMEQFAALSERL